MSAAAVAGLMLWRLPRAFADEPWWDGSSIFRGNGGWYGNRFWERIGTLDAGGGGWQAGTMYTDRWVCARTPWVEWDISASQFIRTATKITMACDFTTELYYHVVGRLEIACGSYNGLNPSYNLWHTDSGEDTRFSLYHAVDDAPAGGALEEAKVVTIDNEAGGGIHRDGAHIWTDYRGYAGSDYSVWIRRTDAVVKHSFQLRSWFWNYYYYGTDWYYNRGDSPPIGFSTPWIEQYADRVYIASNLAWSHRILEIAPAAIPSKRLDVTRAALVAGAGTCIWEAYEATNQNWVTLANVDAERRGTISFSPVHAGATELWLDQAGGGPTKQASAAHLWTGNGGRAQAFWVHDDGSAQWLFADCSGMALDRVAGGVDDGTSVQFHSDGYAAGEWANEAHRWRLSDAVFHAADGLLALEGDVRDGSVQPGETVRVPDPQTSCRPHAWSGSAQDAGMTFSYAWVATETDAAWLSDAPEIVGCACVEGAGWLGEQRGINLVGTVGQGRRLEALRVRVEGSSFPGDVAVRVKALGGAWGGEAAQGAEARPSGGAGIEQVAVMLTGEIARRYTLRYRVCAADGTWGAERCDGEAAGVEGSALHGIRMRLHLREALAEGPRENTFTPGADLEGKRLACVVTAFSVRAGLQYRGVAATEALSVGRRMLDVRFHVDGEEDPCYTDRMPRGEGYAPPVAAVDAGRKEGCSGFDGWYVDMACTVAYVDGTVPDADVLDLYGRNIATVTYAPTDASRELFSSRACSFDASLSEPFAVEAALPASVSVPYGDRVAFGRGRSAWYEDRGKPREAACDIGAYATSAGEGTASAAARITRDTVAYLAWRVPRYDGVAVS